MCFRCDIHRSSVTPFSLNLYSLSLRLSITPKSMYTSDYFYELTKYLVYDQEKASLFYSFDNLVKVAEF